MFGYYGYNNIGDEAILEAIIGQFREIMPDVKLSALSYKAATTSSLYGIHAVSRNRFFDVFRTITRADLVMSGGGSILQDVTSSRSLMYYLGIILLAKMVGKKVAFYGNGFGPITQPLNRKLVKHIINRVDLITVRDEESKRVMEQLGIHQPITVTADAAFTLSLLSDKSTVQKNVTKKTVGISVRSWKNQANFISAIAVCADKLAAEGYEICFLPMQQPSDAVVSRDIIRLMESPAEILQTAVTPRSMIQAISSMDFIIGMRLHSLVFSAIAEVPMVGLSYEAKITSFLKLVQQPCAGDVETITEEQLTQTITEFLANQDKYRDKLLIHKQTLHYKAVKNSEIIRAFLMEGDAAL